jgi:hypothetical protein
MIGCAHIGYIREPARTQLDSRRVTRTAADGHIGLLAIHKGAGSHEHP